MAVLGCKNPKAINYSPSVTQDNFSCKYLFKKAGKCHLFEDVDMELQKDFTLSFSAEGKSWVFFHDYAPDMYVHTREKLYSLFEQEIFLHHEGAPGQYYSTIKKPFFVDAVFTTGGQDLILETVNWISEFLTTKTDQTQKTLTHIAIWNSHQHTGRVSLDKLQQDKTFTTRRTKGEWVFNDFRNILAAKGPEFLKDLFDNYELIPGTNLPEQAWYAKEVLTDSWFCVRFEFDNVENATLLLKETTIQSIKSDR